VCEGEEERKGRRGKHGRIGRGGHGLLKVSLRPTMPYPFMPCRQPPLKRPHGRFRGSRLQGKYPAAVLLPPQRRKRREGCEGEEKKEREEGKHAHMGGAAMDS
jgi:hypothetical protein